jgi:hypothetical protein
MFSQPVLNFYLFLNKKKSEWFGINYEVKHLMTTCHDLWLIDQFSLRVFNDAFSTGYMSLDGRMMVNDNWTRCGVPGICLEGLRKSVNDLNLESKIQPAVVTTQP